MISTARLCTVRWMLPLLWIAACVRLCAALELDIFSGYDGYVHAGGWYPVAIEVNNDGATFDGTFEVSGGQFGNQVQRFKEQLPNGTRKRFVLPCFAASQNFGSIEVRLFDSKGKMLAEHSQQLKSVAWEVPLIGAIPESFSGMPKLPDLKNVRSEWTPVVARMDAAYLPENPVALEGLNTLYLNTAKASQIKQPQADAILGWLNGGGHLILAIDQVSDIAGARWLAPVMPLIPSATATVRPGSELQKWLLSTPARPRHALAAPDIGEMDEASANRKNGDPRTYFQDLRPDSSVVSAELPVVTGSLADGASALISSGRTPLVVARYQGRGLVTVLAFNPEREPVKSWALRGPFWAALTGVPTPYLTGTARQTWSSTSLDSVFASMIETKQIRKLPVGLLLILLVVYLLVIGPFDRWLIKRLGRPMLTWITFPSYVALFSLLIYWIGFKLRAGQTEWTELHIVDVLPMDSAATRAELRGRTFMSLYSPVNETYKIRASQPHSTFRREFQGFNFGNMEGRLMIAPGNEACEADVFVPVWTSQMNVSDWVEFEDSPLRASYEPADGNKPRVKIENHSGGRLQRVWVVSNWGVSEAVEIPDGGSKSTELSPENKNLVSFVAENSSLFANASQTRRQVFGNSDETTRIEDWATASVAACFLHHHDRPAAQSGQANKRPNRNIQNQYMNYVPDQISYVAPHGFDLSQAVLRGDTVVLAWMDDAAPVEPLNKFSAFRNKRATLFRLVIPAATAQP